MEEKIYGGTFKILDKEYNGQIRYSKEKYLVLEIHLNSSTLIDWATEFSLRKMIIHGDIITGAKITLHNCSFLKSHINASQGKTILFFKCEYLIWGNFLNGEIKSLSFELENAMRWSGLSGLTQDYFGEDFFDCVKYKMGNSETFKYKDYDIQLFPSFKNELSRYPRPEKATVSERLCVRIEAPTNKPIMDLMQVMTDVCNIITFCIGNNINILKIKCEEANSYYFDADEKIYFNMEINCVQKSKHIYENQFDIDIVDLEMIKGKIFKKFLDEYQEIKHIIELYVFLITSPELPKHIQFINIVQAVESFHSKFICEKLGLYKESIRNRYKDDKSYEFYKKFLLPPQQDGIDFVVLTTRINDCFSRLPRTTLDYFKDNIISTKLTDTRHYFTHYNKSKYKKSLKNKNLERGISLLCLTLNYLIWQHFGLNRDDYLTETFSHLKVDEMKNDNE